ncbi:MAG: ATP-binding cassette domain-containing protein [Planctomycetota bacterium]
MNASAAAVVETSPLRYEFPGAFRLEVGPIRLLAGRASACFGPSGCGKTTLLRLIAGILRPHEGSVRLLGHDLSALDDTALRALRFGRAGIVFQDFALLSSLSVHANVCLPTVASGGDAAEVRERAADLAERLGVDHTLRRKPHRLSQGERQRVAICRALVGRPSVIICDEPTANLDPDRSRSVIDTLLEQARRLDAGLFVVTHDHGLLNAFDERLELGRTVGVSTGGAETVGVGA